MLSEPKVMYFNYLFCPKPKNLPFTLICFQFKKAASPPEKLGVTFSLFERGQCKWIKVTGTKCQNWPKGYFSPEVPLAEGLLKTQQSKEKNKTGYKIEDGC